MHTNLDKRPPRLSPKCSNADFLLPELVRNQEPFERLAGRRQTSKVLRKDSLQQLQEISKQPLAMGVDKPSTSIARVKSLALGS